jgi:hypothetical protein
MITAKTHNFTVEIVPITDNEIKSYLKKDVVKSDLYQETSQKKHLFRGDEWLFESAAKRVIYYKMYYDLMQKEKLNILDVGSGMNSLMKKVAAKNNYILIEIMNHEKVSVVKDFVKQNEIYWINKPWHDVALRKKFDVVIANDLFPNVDQRLNLFVKAFLPLCHEMRLSITTYPEEKFYKVKRENANEILFVQPWTKKDFVEWLNSLFKLKLKIEKIYPKNIYSYTNKRNVVLINIRNI